MIVKADHPKLLETFERHGNYEPHGVLFKTGKKFFIGDAGAVAFEEKLKTYLGVKYAFGVADGTNALILALKAVARPMAIAWR